MRPLAVLLLLASCSATGCTNLALERHTVRQAGTITDVRYYQVLDNLAMVAHNPASMPYYAMVTGGLAQIDDNVSATGSLTWGWMGGDAGGSSNQQMLGGGGQRTKTGNWSLDPLHDPERMAAMRCVYQTVLGVDRQGCGDCADAIHKFKLEGEMAKIPPGWFHTGCRRDVPKDACYVARYHDTYVWVMPDGVEGLTRLSLIILDIATVDLASLNPTKQVVIKYDGNCKRVGVEVTKEVDLNDPDCPPEERPPAPGPTVKRRRDFTPSLRSLIGPARR